MSDRRIWDILRNDLKSVRSGEGGYDRMIALVDAWAAYIEQKDAEVERLRAAGNRLLAYIEHADLKGESFDTILPEFRAALKEGGEQ